MGKPEGKRPLGRPRSRWVYNIMFGLWVEWVYKDLFVKPEGKSRLGLPRRKCVDNFRIHLWVEGGV